MDLKSQIKDVFKLNIVSIVKNSESSDGNVYNIKTDNNKYIAKIYDDLNIVNNMISLYIYLEKMNIPRIIKTSDGNYFSKYKDNFIVIYSFLEGKQLSKFIIENNNACPDEIVKLIAKEVRKLHDLTSNNSFNFKTIDFANNLNRKSLLHFDLTKENVFINNDKIGFIDFDDAKYGDSICDVAILLSFFFISKKRGVDNKKINIFLDNYYDKCEKELKDEELRYIKTYIKCWVDYLIDRHEFESSLKSSFELKKKSADITYYIDLPRFIIYKRCVSRWVKQKIGEEKYNYKPTLKGLFEMLRWAKQDMKNKNEKIGRIINNSKKYKILKKKDIEKLGVDPNE